MEENKLNIYNSNIIKWYPFEKEKNILQIGEKISIIDDQQKIKQVEKIDEIKDNSKYDYIIIYGYEKYFDLISQIVKFLSLEGKILIIGENATGINNWSKCETKEKNNSLKVEKNDEKSKTIEHIKKELKENNIKNINTYYVFPNYKETELIVNENFNINDSQIEKYNQAISEDEIKLFDEIKVLKYIVTNEKELIKFFANSYIIEASNSEVNKGFKYISFNNCRKQEYQLMTIIKDDVVEKLPVNSKAISHINGMANIINDLKKSDIEILDYVENGKLYSKLIKNEKTLDLILDENYKDFEKIKEILNKLRTLLLRNSQKYEICKNKVKIQEKEELLKKLNYLPKAYWDMIPKNCFYINEKFVFFDQEWEKEYLPVEFIIYRSVINSYDLVRKINVEKLLEELGILEFKNCFEKIDKKLRDEIIEKDIFDKMYCKKITSIDNLINDKKIAESCLKDANEDNKKKQEYIEQLEEDNRRKQEYIISLEEQNKNNREYIKKLENKRRLFWKR